MDTGTHRYSRLAEAQLIGDTQGNCRQGDIRPSTGFTTSLLTAGTAILGITGLGCELKTMVAFRSPPPAELQYYYF